MVFLHSDYPVSFCHPEGRFLEFRLEGVLRDPFARSCVPQLPRPRRCGYVSQPVWALALSRSHPLSCDLAAPGASLGFCCAPHRRVLPSHPRRRGYRCARRSPPRSARRSPRWGTGPSAGQEEGTEVGSGHPLRPLKALLLRTSWSLSCGRSARSGSRGSCSSSRTCGPSGAPRWRDPRASSTSHRRTTHRSWRS